MTKNEAVKIYINNGGYVRRCVISIIQKWDSRQSIPENAKRMGLTYDQAQNVAKNYGLNYVKVGKGHGTGGPKNGRRA